jgi:Xaa-Pro dipeptidase
MTEMNRRRFGGWLAAAVGAGALAPGRLFAGRTSPAPDPCDLPAHLRGLKPMTEGVAPITPAERLARLEQARRLMRENGIGAIVLEPGSSLYYFTGMRWGQSERTFAAVVPAAGELAWVCPAFEEARARELIPAGGEVRVWQEDESPFRLIAGILKDRGVTTGRVGIEENLRCFILDNLRREAPALEYVSADPVTAGCRMIKSPAELALMQRAADITIAAFRATFPVLHEGMTQYDVGGQMSAALTHLGGQEPWVLVGLGEYSAFPHGSVKPQRLREGDIVLIDAGCSFQSYQADITRTSVLGKPSERQTRVWNLERKAQDAAFAAARPGATCESVDAAARKVITDAGFGPGYRVPGLPHRTGHGIGLDGHEWTYLVRGNQTKLRPGMCFSDEPTIVIYGEFGIRLEDCMHITEDGARFFSPQSESITRPV